MIMGKMMAMMMMLMIKVSQHIPIITKSHHGGNMSVMDIVGFFHRRIPTIDNDNDDIGKYEVGFPSI